MGAKDRIVGVDEVSSQLPGLEGLPSLDLRGALRLAPDLVLVGELPAGEAGFDPDRVSPGTEILEFAPHGFEDVVDLCRTVGARLVGTVRANRFEMEFARPLARIGGSSFGEARPRVVAVVGFDPLELAGGHSFENDLIEIAGGSSVTHGSEESRILVDARGWAELAPDLVVVMMPGELGEAQRSAALEAIPPRYALAYFPFEAEFFWLHEPAEAARRLRGLLRERTRASASKR